MLKIMAKHGLGELEKLKQDIEGRGKEVEAKCTSLRQHLVDHDYDAMVITRKDAFAWITAGANNGVLLNTEFGNSSVVVTLDKKIVVASVIESPRLIEEEYIRELGFEVMEIPWTDDLACRVFDVLQPSARVASDTSMAGTELVDLRAMRYNLTESEIERYALSGRCVTTLLEQTALTLKPGVSEYDVVGTVAKNLWQVGIEPVNLMCAADKRIELYRHPLPINAPIEKTCMISLGARFCGLVTSLTRTIAFGSISAEFRERKLRADSIAAAMIEHTRPGTSTADILGVARKKYQDFNIGAEYNRHHQGGAIGYLSREYRVGPSCKQEVHTNQAFCWNPTVGGAKCEETILCRETGTVSLTEPVLFEVSSETVENCRCHFAAIQNVW